MIFPLALSALVILAVVTALWFRQRSTKNATAIDVAWVFGIAAQTIFLASQTEGHPIRKGIVTGLVVVWALRLGLHLYTDRVKTGKEDPRYAQFRADWSPLAFYGMYIMQGVLIFLLPLTFLGALTNRAPFPSVLDGASLTLWIIAWWGEAISDNQLANFRANPANKGKTCRDGLWRYSRHPNYFFEWLMWCSYIPMALGSSWYMWSILGPSLLLYLLLKVSGVPPTEKQALKSRGDDYRDYQNKTSVFFPWFPRK